MIRWSAAVLAWLGFALPRAAIAPPVVEIVAREYAFDAPDSIASGPTTIHLVSRGREQHFVWIARIASPHTLAEFKQTLGKPGTPPWITQVGGVGTIEPGGSASTTIDLAPGSYVLECDMEDSKGTPHMMEGMIRELVVTAARNDAKMPAADIRMDLSDYAFTLPTPIHAGAHVIEVRNTGSQPHMAMLWRLHAGKTLANVVKWMDAVADPGPAPVTLLGGTPDMDPGALRCSSRWSSRRATTCSSASWTMCTTTSHTIHTAWCARSRWFTPRSARTGTRARGSPFVRTRAAR